MYTEYLMIDVEDLRTFVDIVDGGSLRTAATKRGVTPSLVSRRLRQLESRLGVELITRTTRSLSLTDAGQRFDGHARDVLSRMADAVDDMQGRTREPRGLLRVAAPHSYGSERFAPVFSEFLLSHPQVTGELVLSDVRADLVGNGFDAAIRIGTLEDSDLVARPLEPYCMGLFAAPAYLARMGTPQSAEELTDHDAVELMAAAGRPWRLSGSAGQVVGRPRRKAVASNGHALKQMAISGLGIIAQPQVFVASEVASGALVPILTNYELPTRMVHLLYRRGRYMPAHLRAFVTVVCQQLSSALQGRSNE